MSGPQRKVHVEIWEQSPRGQPYRRASCGAVVTGGESQAFRFADTHAFCFLPRVAQCARCRAGNPSRMGHGTAATPLHIIAVSLFCAGLVGCLAATLTALIDGCTEEGLRVALDVAEERGGEPWEVVEREWIEGPHETCFYSFRFGSA